MLTGYHFIAFDLCSYYSFFWQDRQQNQLLFDFAIQIIVELPGFFYRKFDK